MSAIEIPSCTCPSGDGSLRWPCPEHPPAGTVAGDVRQLQLALDALLQPWLDAAEWLCARIEYLSGILLDWLQYAGRQLAAVARFAGTYLSRPQLDAPAGEPTAGGELPAGYADTVTLDIDPDMSKFVAGVLGVELQPWQLATFDAIMAGREPLPQPAPAVYRIPPAGDDAGELHPSHEWIDCGTPADERFECARCAVCTCCDGRLAIEPCDTVDMA